MKDIFEYYPNGIIKHKSRQFNNGKIYYECFYDENGETHDKNGLPSYQQWHENGTLACKLYIFHGQNHKSSNPSGVSFYENGKIFWKHYYLNDILIRRKLNWMNSIKNI